MGAEQILAVPWWQAGWLIDLAVVAGFSSVAMLVTWIWQFRTRNASFVDITWACCLSFAALYYGATGEGAMLPRLLVGVLGALWGFRLANHLLARVLSEKEDGRYAYLRAYWKDSQWKFFWFFQGQVLLVLLFSTPFRLAAQNHQDQLNSWLILGCVIWLISVLGESIADRQLAVFRQNPNNRGRTCRTGLWRYSRHPNYFFEWLHWFSYCCFAVGAVNAAWALVGPITMLITLCWFTGIPFVEAQSLRSRGEDYRDYQRTTSAFFPWFSKAGKSSRRSTESEPG